MHKLSVRVRTPVCLRQRTQPRIQTEDKIGSRRRPADLSATTPASLPTIAFESGQFSSLLGIVAAGVGVSLIPEMAIDRNAGCRYVLSDPKATRTIVAATLRSRSLNRIQRAFLSELKARSMESNR
jgi:LysR family hydrogen peroxide-inducible transcriptional activator